MKKNLQFKGKIGQVWIETVIYTLIAFVLIGAVLAFAKPKIEEAQDKALVEGGLSILTGIDTEILSLIQGGSGNQRVVEINLRKGEIILDGEMDQIRYEVESRYKYSEPDTVISQGNVQAITRTKGRLNEVELKVAYNNYNITYESRDLEKIISKSPGIQKLVISNEGEENDKIKINFRLN